MFSRDCNWGIECRCRQFREASNINEIHDRNEIRVLRRQYAVAREEWLGYMKMEKLFPFFDFSNKEHLSLLNWIFKCRCRCADVEKAIFSQGQTVHSARAWVKAARQVTMEARPT